MRRLFRAPSEVADRRPHEARGSQVQRVEALASLSRAETYNEQTSAYTAQVPSHAVIDRRTSDELTAKRAFDIVAALVALVLLAPLFLLVIALIKATSPGPAFFRQARYGRGGGTFRIWKFRTMRVAEQDPSGVAQTRPGDPRVTAVGRFLRQTNIDELPQLLNVLVGDMSLVGPRPHVPGMLAGGRLYEDLVPRYFERLAARPGLTGLAQVNGCRGPTDDATAARCRIAYDLLYIRKQSFALDLKIVLLTLWSQSRSGC